MLIPILYSFIIIIVINLLSLDNEEMYWLWKIWAEYLFWHISTVILSKILILSMYWLTLLVQIFGKYLNVCIHNSINIS